MSPGDAPSSKPAPSSNLPAALTSFVGRRREVAEVQRLLSTTRLLTLVGSGGVGKTRLARHVAAEVVDAFPDGVWLAELATTSDGALVPQVAAAALGLHQPGYDALETLLGFLQARQSLLVLDNCEHLAPACAAVADALLRACPRLQIMATSRQSLKIDGETAWLVPALSLPDPAEPADVETLSGFEAVRLFLERAAAVRPGFELTAQNAAAVVQICCRLDGIPLALELAAARMRVLSAEQIADRLDDRFRLLTGGSRAALPHQQTLRDTIDWSHDLLSPDERTLFRRFAIFAGGWTFEAAESVCAGDGIAAEQVLDLLSDLVDRSFVLVEERGGASRYRMLETIRAYAREKLGQSGEETALAERHRDWFLALAEQAEAEWRGEHQVAWVQRLETEHDNLRGTLDTAEHADGWLEPAYRLAGALWWFWSMRGYLREGRDRLARLLARISVPEDPISRARVLHAAGRLAIVQGDYADAVERLSECLALWQTSGRQESVADALHDLAMAAHGQGDRPLAIGLYEQSLALGRALGDPVRTYLALDHLGEVLHDQGDLERAALLYQEALGLQLPLGHRRGVAVSSTNLASVAQRRGDLARSEWLYQESLTLLADLGDRRRIAACLEGLAANATARLDHVRAARLLGAAEAIGETSGALLPAPHRASHNRAVFAVQASLEEEAFDRAWAEGRALGLDRAMQYARGELQLDPHPPAAPGPATSLPPGSPLTRREREVAVLVARGLTNRQIGSELTITEGTAGIHIEHILNKLTFHSRAQIAAWAVEQRLTNTRES